MEICEWRACRCFSNAWGLRSEEGWVEGGEGEREREGDEDEVLDG